MTGRSEDYDRTIAKHIVIRCERAHLSVLKRIVIFELLALPRLLPEHEVPLGFIDDPGRAFEEVCIPRMIEMRMRSEEHTSELQSLMRISYAVFCLKKKKYTMHKYYI